MPGCLGGARIGFAQQGLELGKDRLDRVEIGRVARQEEQLGAGAADQLADRLALMAAEVVHDDNVTGAERGDQELFDESAKAGAVDRPVDDARGGEDDLTKPQLDDDGVEVTDLIVGGEPMPALGACKASAHCGFFHSRLDCGCRAVRVITTQHDGDCRNAYQRQKNAIPQRRAKFTRQRGDEKTDCAADIPATLRWRRGSEACKQNASPGCTPLSSMWVRKGTRQRLQSIPIISISATAVARRPRNQTLCLEQRRFPASIHDRHSK